MMKQLTLGILFRMADRSAGFWFIVTVALSITFGFLIGMAVMSHGYQNLLTLGM